MKFLLSLLFFVLSPVLGQGVPVNCTDTSGQHLNYTSATHAYSCGTSVTSSVVTLTGVQTLTNKRITQRVCTVADATSITPDSDSCDVVYQANTQGAGTLTVNAPTGTPTDGQRLIIRLSSTSAQTFSFNGTYRFSTQLTAPVTSTSSSKYDYLVLMYNSITPKWDVVGANFGF